MLLTRLQFLLEMLPGQGGTNSKVVADMYTTLNAEKKQEFLKVFWYTAKDQEKPIDASEKRRNCHGMELHGQFRTGSL